MIQRLALLLLAICLVQCSSVRTTEANMLQSSQQSSTYRAGAYHSHFDIQLVAPRMPQALPFHSFLHDTDTVRIIGTQYITIHDTALLSDTMFVMTSDTTTRTKYVDGTHLVERPPWLQLFFGFGALFLLIYILSRPR